MKPAGMPVPADNPARPVVVAHARCVMRMRPSWKSSIWKLFVLVVDHSTTLSNVKTTRLESCIQETLPPVSVG